MIVGSLASNPSQAGALGPALGMLLGLVGGAMVPREVFPEAMRNLAYLTPHAWAMDAIAALKGPSGGIAEALPELVVLGAYAVVFFGIAVWRFHRVLQRGA
jgi:ABC-2 type transport system permease protein